MTINTNSALLNPHPPRQGTLRGALRIPESHRAKSPMPTHSENQRTPHIPGESLPNHPLPIDVFIPSSKAPPSPPPALSPTSQLEAPSRARSPAHFLNARRPALQSLSADWKRMGALERRLRVAGLIRRWPLDTLLFSAPSVRVLNAELRAIVPRRIAGALTHEIEHQARERWLRRPLKQAYVQRVQGTIDRLKAMTANRHLLASFVSWARTLEAKDQRKALQHCGLGGLASAFRGKMDAGTNDEVAGWLQEQAPHQILGLEQAKVQFRMNTARLLYRHVPAFTLDVLAPALKRSSIPAKGFPFRTTKVSNAFQEIVVEEIGHSGWWIRLSNQALDGLDTFLELNPSFAKGLFIIDLAVDAVIELRAHFREYRLRRLRNQGFSEATLRHDEHYSLRLEGLLFPN